MSEKSEKAWKPLKEAKKPTRMVAMRLTDEEIEKIKAAGYGCFVAGIRRMLQLLDQEQKAA